MMSCPSRKTVAANGTTSPEYALVGKTRSGVVGESAVTGIRPTLGSYAVATGATLPGIGGGRPGLSGPRLPGSAASAPRTGCMRLHRKVLSALWGTATVVPVEKACPPTGS
jgi:hypothetical protein